MLLIDAAEKFFGVHGLNGSSLREIAAAAGQRNYNAVQYHFGSKRGLINAILDVRFREVDAIRAQMIAQNHAGSNLGEMTVEELLRLIWEPVIAIGSPEGMVDFCRFQLQYRLNSYEADHPFYAGGGNVIPVEAIDRTEPHPRVYEVAEALRRKFPQVDDTTFYKRTATISYMFLCFVVARDNAGKHGERSDFDADFDLILNMMIAALSAPA